MYFCTDCKKKFLKTKIVFQEHDTKEYKYEKIAVCPFCGGQGIGVITVRHCRSCGARLAPDNPDVYCNLACKKRGEKMWQKEYSRKLKSLTDPIVSMVKEICEYNKKNKTNLSYGQYVALKI